MQHVYDMYQATKSEFIAWDNKAELGSGICSGKQEGMSRSVMDIAAPARAGAAQSRWFNERHQHFAKN